MATRAQCYYCFESIEAAFENEEPPSLGAIEDLWEQHEQAKQLAFLNDKAVDAEYDDEYDVHTEQNSESGRVGKTENRPPNITLPSITRLQQGLPSDSSSTSTTPSTTSATSSRSALSNVTGVTTPMDTPGSRRQQKYPLFVTWNSVSKNGHKSLRGCIGTFEAQELSYGLKSYALTSAFDDTRFSPIPSSLLPHLSCSLTLLSDFEPCSDAMDWELGTHGLRISFIYRNRRYGATYLPDVAPEQGWTKEETVESLMRKAGWDGRSSGMARRLLRTGSGSGSSGSESKPWEEVSDFKATRYQGLQASADYREWQEWRKWVESDESRLALLESS